MKQISKQSDISKYFVCYCAGIESRSFEDSVWGYFVVRTVSKYNIYTPG